MSGTRMAWIMREITMNATKTQPERVIVMRKIVPKQFLWADNQINPYAPVHNASVHDETQVELEVDPPVKPPPTESDD